MDRVSEIFSRYANETHVAIEGFCIAKHPLLAIERMEFLSSPSKAWLASEDALWHVLLTSEGYWTGDCLHVSETYAHMFVATAFGANFSLQFFQPQTESPVLVDPDDHPCLTSG